MVKDGGQKPNGASPKCEYQKAGSDEAEVYGSCRKAGWVAGWQCTSAWGWEMGEGGWWADNHVSNAHYTDTCS